MDDWIVANQKVIQSSIFYLYQLAILGVMHNNAVKY
jgi:hypothetical protein